MFSHTLHNPNNIVLKDNYYAIPFGHRCASAIACKYASIRHFSLPFDWVRPLFPNQIQKVIENNFSDFVPDVYGGVLWNKYGIHLTHFNADIAKGLDEYTRRIERFHMVMNDTNTLYFVYFNEDYLFDPEYRKDAFLDGQFHEMLELESFLKEKYPAIDYSILYVDFKKHDIPTTSNILNIVLESTTLYDVPEGSTFNELREYVGILLTELFHTKLDLGYSLQTFNDS